jgi:O-antigen ligase
MTEKDKYFLIVVFILGGLVSYLILSTQYTILFLIFLLMLFFIIIIVNFRLLVYYFMLFGALTDPGLSKLWGVSVNWLRNTTLVILYFFYLIFLFKKFNVYKKNENFKIFINGIIPFFLYISTTIFWSVSPIDSLRFMPKYILSVLLFFVILFDDKLDVKKSIKFIFYGAFIFLIASVVVEYLSNIGIFGIASEYFEGFSGRHQSKFYVVFIIVFMLSGLFTRYFDRFLLTLLGITISFIILILILQRGAFLAVLLSVVFISIYLIRRFSIASIVLSLILIISFSISIYLLFKRPEFQEYTFVSETYSIEDFLSFILKGDFETAINMITFKGRLEMWSASLEIFKNKLFGQGLATTAVEMEEVRGIFVAIHNDFLQFLIEGGYVGFVLFMIMWLNLFRISWRFRKTVDKTLKFLAMTIGAYSAGLFGWSFFDHVSSYSNMNFSFLFILIGLLIKADTKLKNYH